VPVEGDGAGSRRLGGRGFVPVLWSYEPRNVLVIGERRGRSTKKETARGDRCRPTPAVSDQLERLPDEVAVITLRRKRAL
jgi:hypothetical protein